MRWSQQKIYRALHLAVSLRMAINAIGQIRFAWHNITTYPNVSYTMQLARQQACPLPKQGQVGHDSSQPQSQPDGMRRMFSKSATHHQCRDLQYHVSSLAWQKSAPSLYQMMQGFPRKVIFGTTPRFVDPECQLPRQQRSWNQITENRTVTQHHRACIVSNNKLWIFSKMMTASDFPSLFNLVSASSYCQLMPEEHRLLNEGRLIPRPTTSTKVQPPYRRYNEERSISVPFSDHS